VVSFSVRVASTASRQVHNLLCVEHSSRDELLSALLRKHFCNGCRAASALPLPRECVYVHKTVRIVIKIGASLIARRGRIDANLLRACWWIRLTLHETNLIVTGGAIAASMSGLSFTKRPTDVPRMQACADCGTKVHSKGDVRLSPLAAFRSAGSYARRQ
jgi:hypothetical protein